MTPARTPLHRLTRHLVAVAAAALVAVGLVANPASAPSAEAAVPTHVATKAVKVASHQRGVPYRWGGMSPKRGFDCSGLVKYSYAKAGERVPRTAQAQYRASKHIKRRHRRKGDLVFFYSGRSIYHVAIYAGHGRIWHAPRPGKRVQKVRIWTSHVKYGRVR